jgi:hypothetical protein
VTDTMQLHRQWRAAFLPAAREAIARGDYGPVPPQDEAHRSFVLAGFAATAMMIGTDPQLPIPNVSFAPGAVISRHIERAKAVSRKAAA